MVYSPRTDAGGHRVQGRRSLGRGNFGELGLIQIFFFWKTCDSVSFLEENDS